MGRRKICLRKKRFEPVIALPQLAVWGLDVVYLKVVLVKELKEKPLRV